MPSSRATARNESPAGPTDGELAAGGGQDLGAHLAVGPGPCTDDRLVSRSIRRSLPEHRSEM